MRQNPGAARGSFPSSPQQRQDLLLVVFGLALLALFWPASRALQDRRVELLLGLMAVQAILCLIAASVIWKGGSSRVTFAFVIGIALLLRAALLFQTPILSDDIYRYIWDGRVQAAGINPYRYIPADPKLAALRDDKIYPFINRRDYARTIYPPVAQICNFAITRVSETVTWFKTAMVFAEGVTVWALASLLVSFGLPRERVLIYAWNPLVLWEFAGSGHIDALMIALVMLALLARRRGKNFGVGAWLACAGLVKFYPLVLFPALYRRWDWKAPVAAAAVVIGGYALYLSVGLGVFGFLPGYTNEEGIARGRYVLFLLVEYLGGHNLPVVVYFGFAAVILALLGAWALFRARKRAFALAAGVLAFAFTVLLSPIYPWYWTWVTPFLAFLPWRFCAPCFYVVVVTLGQYAHWFDRGEFLGMSAHLAKGVVQFLPFVIWVGVVLVLDRRERKTRTPDDSPIGWSEMNDHPAGGADS